MTILSEVIIASVAVIRFWADDNALLAHNH